MRQTMLGLKFLTTRKGLMAAPAFPIHALARTERDQRLGRARPSIDPRYLTDEKDQQDVVASIRLARQVATQAALACFVVRERASAARPKPTRNCWTM